MPTITASLDRDEKWNYYIQTYMMREPTEGIPINRCQKVFLRRTYPAESEVDALNAEKSIVRENMEVRICVNTYRLFFQQHGEDLVMKDPKFWPIVPPGTKEKRREKWKGVLGQLGWMKEASEEEKEEKKREWERFLKGGLKRRSVDEGASERPEKRARGDDEMGGM
jgi:paired amphipathic helix protein Sin3a